MMTVLALGVDHIVYLLPRCMFCRTCVAVRPAWHGALVCTVLSSCTDTKLELLVQQPFWQRIDAGVVAVDMHMVLGETLLVLG
jgi:hypothetical protein